MQRQTNHWNVRRVGKFREDTMEHSQDVSALSQVIPSLTGGTPEPGASNDVPRPELCSRHSACRFLIRVLVFRLVGAPRDRVFHAARPSLVLWRVTLEQAELDLRRLARRHDPPLIGHHVVQRGQFCQRCWRSSHEKKEENADEKWHAGRSHFSFPPRQFDWKLRYFERMSGDVVANYHAPLFSLPYELQSTILLAISRTQHSRPRGKTRRETGWQIGNNEDRGLARLATIEIKGDLICRADCCVQFN